MFERTKSTMTARKKEITGKLIENRLLAEPEALIVRRLGFAGVPDGSDDLPAVAPSVYRSAISSTTFSMV